MNNTNAFFYDLSHMPKNAKFTVIKCITQKSSPSVKTIKEANYKLHVAFMSSSSPILPVILFFIKVPALLHIPVMEKLS